MGTFFASLPHKFDYDVVGGISTVDFCNAAHDALAVFGVCALVGVCVLVSVWRAQTLRV